jgi:two-component system, chemotaxis family, protein-glutamate methylesterase/glutaminase
MTSSSSPSFGRRSRRPRRRVLIADDSEFMRVLLREHILQAGFEIAGEALTGYQAIRLVHELDPDIVTMDLDMPELGGLDAIRYIMDEAPRPIVIVSSQTAALADPALTAMLRGAVEFVPKPSGSGVASDVFRRQLRHALHTAAIARQLGLSDRLQLLRQLRPGAPRPTAAELAAAHAERLARERIPGAARCAVALGASTGGPRALAGIVPYLPGDIPAAVFIVQHMPPVFTGALARRLDGAGELPVQEAEDGEIVNAGRVYLAPGGRHLELKRVEGVVRIRLSEAGPVWGVRPAVDVLFAAVARTFGPASVGVVLTGMGRDGAAGLRAIQEVGGCTLVQDEPTSIIPSMPKAASIWAERVVPLQDLAGAIVRCAIERSRAGAAGR